MKAPKVCACGKPVEFSNKTEMYYCADVACYDRCLAKLGLRRMTKAELAARPKDHHMGGTPR